MKELATCYSRQEQRIKSGDMEELEKIFSLLTPLHHKAIGYSEIPRKTSSFSARLSSHAAKTDVTFHSNHMHTPCSHMGSHGNRQECAKPAGFTVCKQTAMWDMAVLFT